MKISTMFALIGAAFAASLQPIFPIEILEKFELQDGCLNRKLAGHDKWVNSPLNPVVFWEMMAFDTSHPNVPILHPFYDYAVGKHALDESECELIERFLPSLNGHPYLQYDVEKVHEDCEGLWSSQRVS